MIDCFSSDSMRNADAYQVNKPPSTGTRGIIQGTRLSHSDHVMRVKRLCWASLYDLFEVVMITEESGIRVRAAFEECIFNILIDSIPTTNSL